MKTLFTLLLLVVTTVCIAQTDQENLEKYWHYRSQLKTRFTKIDTTSGSSIPAAVIIPNRQYGQVDQSTGSIIQWRDATITLGHYWLVLALEYKMLAENGEDVQATLNELYYAMYAFKRLDRKAEGYLGGNLSASASISDENGFFIRGDQLHSITDNWRFDPPLQHGTIQPDAGHPNQMRSDYEGWLYYDSGGMGNEVQTVTPQFGSSESLDQLVSLLVGLRFIEKFVPDTWVQPTPEDQGFYIKTEAREIIKRLVYYLNDMSHPGMAVTSAQEWTLKIGDIRLSEYFRHTLFG